MVVLVNCVGMCTQLLMSLQVFKCREEFSLQFQSYGVVTNWPFFLPVTINYDGYVFNSVFPIS
eukprot:c41904_g1_i1 orf=44-232(-)